MVNWLHKFYFDSPLVRGTRAIQLVTFFIVNVHLSQYYVIYIEYNFFLIITLELLDIFYLYLNATIAGLYSEVNTILNLKNFTRIFVFIFTNIYDITFKF